jgi:sugar/nucleoside kinase (ribokinase family)
MAAVFRHRLRKEDRRTMTTSYDVCAVGNAIVDVIAPVEDAFLATQSLTKGSMGLIDEDRAASLYAALPPGLEASGGSAGNTVAGVASFGGTAAYIGKVAKDQLGEVFAHDMRAGGVAFDVAPLVGGAATARSLIAVTPDGQRTMSTFLGASNQLTEADVDEALVASSSIVYLEGYLFDPPPARAAFSKAARAARAAGRSIALTLSDAFVVDRHREGLLAFLPMVDVVFANEAEALSLMQTDDFETAASGLSKLVKIAAVTRGEKGSVVLARHERTSVEAVAVDSVLDTTGAGDQYAAGFLFGLARGFELERCARLGHLAACEVIGHYGPRPQVRLEDLAREKGLI